MTNATTSKGSDMSGKNAELIAWGKMLGGREQELADALEAAEAETDAAKTVRQIGEISASMAMSPQQALSVLGIYGRIASAEAERDATERDWADYFEEFDSTVGTPALTLALVVSLLRGPRPFGAMASATK